MTELDQFMDEAKTRGGMTLSDHLTASGFTEDFNLRKSMETQVVRAIMDGRYKDMRGTVIFPSETTRAGWADNIERRRDQHPRPKFTTSLALRRDVDPIVAKHDEDWHYQGGRGTAVAVKGAVEAVATSSRRRQDLVATAIVRQSDELDWAQEGLERARERITELTTERDRLLAQLNAANQHVAKLVDAFTHSDQQLPVLAARVGNGQHPHA